MATAAVAGRQARGKTTLWDWLTTTDHKKIGILYLGVTGSFFLIGGMMALLMRIQLATPNNNFLTPSEYDQLFTLHGTTMVFLYVIPVFSAFGNFLIPLQIGARDMAFPRINALALWLLPLGGLLIYSGLFTSTGAAANGWTEYVPLSEKLYSPGVGVDLWILGLHIVGISSMLGAANFMVTIANLRAPGMTLFRMPLFTWATLVNSAMIIGATPFIAGALAMLLLDRQLGTHFFLPGQGGNAVLYQFLFWFYSHPAVYLMVLPAFGIVSEIISVFARKPVFGYRTMAFAMVAIVILGFMVFAHHMFTVGLPLPVQVFFMASSMAISVPTGIKIFNWLATMWGGSIRYTTAMLFAVAFVLQFLVGGVSGMYLAVVPVDYQLHATYFVVAHFHYIVMGASTFAVFAGAFFWWPKMFGRMLDETLGKIQFWILVAGVNLTFLPMFIAGVEGMPRRIFTYSPDRPWGIYNLLATIGGFVLAAGILIFLINVIITARQPQQAVADDPWEANSLEWTLPSPVPVYNFDRIPVVRSLRPARDARRAAAAAASAPVRPSS